MKRVPVGKNEYAMVDDDDYARVSAVNWYITGHGYAYSEKVLSGKTSKILMTHFIMGKPEKGFVVDHINRNRLDNRKDNLRFCTLAQNNMNRKMQKNNTSGYTGVFWHKPAKKWQVFICIDKKQTHVGIYADKKEAALAYNEAAKEHYGEFARLNVITD